jgi:hypothetical protein
LVVVLCVGVGVSVGLGVVVIVCVCVCVCMCVFVSRAHHHGLTGARQPHHTQRPHRQQHLCCTAHAHNTHNTDGPRQQPAAGWPRHPATRGPSRVPEGVVRCVRAHGAADPDNLRGFRGGAARVWAQRDWRQRLTRRLSQGLQV